jgi:hypothetical protein
LAKSAEGVMWPGFPHKIFDCPLTAAMFRNRIPSIRVHRALLGSASTMFLPIPETPPKVQSHKNVRTSSSFEEECPTLT